MRNGTDVLADLRATKAAVAKARQGAERRDADMRRAEAARVRARRGLADALRAYEAAREAVGRAYPDGV